MIKAGLQRRLEKLEGRSLAHTLAAQPEGESKRLFLARLAAIRQRLEAARDRGEYVPTVDVGEVKQRLRALLEGHKK
jgi:hypothetical protein